MNSDRQRVRDERLKNRIDRLQKQLEAICENEGHKLEERRQEETRLVGSHLVMERFTECDHMHRCSCPIVEKPRSEPDYKKVVTIHKKCCRCGFESREQRQTYVF